MVEITSEWALVIATLGLAGATSVLAWFTLRLAKESKRLGDLTALLADQARRQVEVSKLALKQEAISRGMPPVRGLDEV